MLSMVVTAITKPYLKREGEYIITCVLNINILFTLFACDYGHPLWAYARAHTHVFSSYYCFCHGLYIFVSFISFFKVILTVRDCIMYFKDFRHQSTHANDWNDTRYLHHDTRAWGCLWGRCPGVVWDQLGVPIPGHSHFTLVRVLAKWGLLSGVDVTSHSVSLTWFHVAQLYSILHLKFVLLLVASVGMRQCVKQWASMQKCKGVGLLFFNHYLVKYFVLFICIYLFSAWKVKTNKQSRSHSQFKVNLE